MKDEGSLYKRAILRIEGAQRRARCEIIVVDDGIRASIEGEALIFVVHQPRTEVSDEYNVVGVAPALQRRLSQNVVFWPSE